MISARGRRKVPNTKSHNVIFSAYAFNDDRVKSATATRSLEVPDGAPLRRGRAYVIAVGVNETKRSDILRLRYAVSDARRLRQTLGTTLVGTRQFSDVITIGLVSGGPGFERGESAATKSSLKALLDLLAGRPIPSLVKESIPGASLIRKADPDDVVILTFSGNTYTDQLGTLHLIPGDVGSQSAPGQAEFDRRTISSDDLAAWLRSVDSDITLILDACYSGAVVGPNFKPGPGADATLGQLAYDKGMRILTATTGLEVAFELEKLGSGLLTYALVDVLKEEPVSGKNGEFSLDNWLESARRRVGEVFAPETKGSLGVRGVQQTPILFNFSQGPR